jgi:hypothetical protein
VEPLPPDRDPPLWDEAKREAHLGATTELDEAYEKVSGVRPKLGLPVVAAARVAGPAPS